MTTEQHDNPQPKNTPPGHPWRNMLSATMPLWPVAFARMLIGVLWLFSLRWKLPPSFDGGNERGLRTWLELEVEHPVIGLYGDLIDNVVLPNFTLFAWLLFLTELLVGISLLFGLFTRLGAAMGLVMALNLGIGLAEVPGEWPWSYMMLAMWHGLFVVGAAGRVLGLDATLRSKVLTPPPSPDPFSTDPASSEPGTASKQPSTKQLSPSQRAVALFT